MTRHVARRMFAFSALLFAVACSDASSPLSSQDAVARARWAANRPASYQYTMTIGCFCITEVTRHVVVAVNGNAVVSRTYVDNGAPVPEQYSASFPSIDGLFDIVAAARAAHAARVDASYDATLGFPVSVCIDREAMAADDEISYGVSGFLAR